MKERVYRCAKCSIEDWSMKYLSHADVLKLTCNRCGYFWLNEPFDKKEEE